MVFKINWKVLVLAIVVGVCIGIKTGFIVKQPQRGFMGNKFFGFSLIWRISEMETDVKKHSYFELTIDYFLGSNSFCHCVISELVKS